MCIEENGSTNRPGRTDEWRKGFLLEEFTI